MHKAVVWACVVFALIVGAPIGAQEHSSTLVSPVVARTTGVGTSQWASDLTVSNLIDQPVTVGAFETQDVVNTGDTAELARSHDLGSVHFSPHYPPGFVTRAARRCAQWGFRPEGRGGVVDTTLSTPRRENTAECDASPPAVEVW